MFEGRQAKNTRDNANCNLNGWEIIMGMVDGRKKKGREKRKNEETEKGRVNEGERHQNPAGGVDGWMLWKE